VRLIDLAAAAPSTAGQWSRLERLQEAVTQLQQTGRVDGVTRTAYTVQPAPATLQVSIPDGHLRIDADDQSATIALTAPEDVPTWLTVEPAPARRPGNVVTWAVDRVRAEIGDEAMQYIKAVAFSALEVVLKSKEDLTGDTGEEDIAADLGQDTLEPATRQVPVDPDIGFPPPPLETWVTPTLPGEGTWQPKNDDPFIHQLPGLPPTFVTTFIRSDRRRKVTRVYIALWDPRVVQLDMMAGIAEPKSATGATGPGMIPREPTVLRRVAAAMNAGFQALHGEYGMMSDGVIYLPPKAYGATVAKLRDGTTAFGTWPKDARIPTDMLSYRQNMTPLVVDAKFNPYGRTWWGGTPSDWEDKTHTVRTGICLTKEGFVGYFYGADLSPASLARAQIQARCQYGVALDMNAGHSGLEFYRVAPADEFEPLGRPLNRDWEREGKVPKMDGWTFRARRLIRGMGLMHFPRYIKREGRDYFYLTLRYVLPGEPLDGAEGWQVKGLPQHGYPYALARTSVTLPSGNEAWVLKIDPRQLTSDDAAAVNAKDGGKALVALLNPPPQAERSVWLTQNALSIGSEPPLTPATMVASGSPLLGAADVVAAFGVEDAAGMGVYVQVVGAKASAAELHELLVGYGVGESIALAAPLAVALGGDTSLTGDAVRLAPASNQLRLLRKPAAGSKRIFEGTPVVPLKEWFPLQSRRIRYFKKRKKKDT